MDIFICAADQHPAHVILLEEPGCKLGRFLQVAFHGLLTMPGLPSNASHAPMQARSAAAFGVAHFLPQDAFLFGQFPQMETEQARPLLIYQRNTIPAVRIQQISQRFDIRLVAHKDPAAERHGDRESPEIALQRAREHGYTPPRPLAFQFEILKNSGLVLR